jgi:hypothetical protein
MYPRVSLGVSGATVVHRGHLVTITLTQVRTTGLPWSDFQGALLCGGQRRWQVLLVSWVLLE